MKSATEDASLGISQASIVEDRAHLKERIDFIHENTKTDALVEEYIEGRELYVGVCGNERLTTFPVWEMDFGTLPDVKAGIATRKVKWDLKYQKKHGIRTGQAPGLSRRRPRAARPAQQAHLPRAAPVRLRAHGFPHAPRRQRCSCSRRTAIRT